MTPRAPKLLVACGLKAEARIAAGPRARTVCSGGVRFLLEDGLAAISGEGVAGVLSFGVAGGLAAGLAPGAVVIGEDVVSEQGRFPCDPGWRRRLLERLPGAKLADLFGADAPAATARDKARLAANSGAAAVDMESHIAARWAARHGAPFAAIRVVCDPAERSLPPAALVGLRTDGATDILAVLQSLAAKPQQLPSLLRTARDAGLAFEGLKGCRRALGDGFGLFD